eukprot:2567564-Heterocapsa_arctica.AAC.1
MATASPRVNLDGEPASSSGSLPRSPPKRFEPSKVDQLTRRDNGRKFSANYKEREEQARVKLADIERLALAREARSEIEVGKVPELSQHSEQAIQKYRDEEIQPSQQKALEGNRKEAWQVEEESSLINPEQGEDRP